MVFITLNFLKFYTYHLCITFLLHYIFCYQFYTIDKVNYYFNPINSVSLVFESTKNIGIFIKFI